MKSEFELLLLLSQDLAPGTFCQLAMPWLQGTGIYLEYAIQLHKYEKTDLQGGSVPGTLATSSLRSGIAGKRSCHHLLASGKETGRRCWLQYPKRSAAPAGRRGSVMKCAADAAVMEDLQPALSEAAETDTATRMNWQKGKNMTVVDLSNISTDN